MGIIFPKATESLLPSCNREIEPQNPVQTQAAALTMDGGSSFNNFMEQLNHVAKIAKNWHDRYDKVSRDYLEMKKENEQIKTECERLRQRINNDSERSHRSHQSASEDAKSKNKRSEVLIKCKQMDGNTRRKAIEAFGKGECLRPELLYRKALTCRIFLAAYILAKRTKEQFREQILPRFFQSAASESVYFDEEPSKAIELIKQPLSAEMQPLLTTESFKVACSSVLKEMAVKCDLTVLEEKFIEELMNRREEWRERYWWLPYLDDSTINDPKMKNYIKECLRLAWRMVNLLPPLKIVSVDEVRSKKEYFEVETGETKENAQTMRVCVWPAVIDCDNDDEALAKGSVAIILRPKNLSSQV